MHLSPQEMHLYLSAQSVLFHEESCWWRECTRLRWWLHTLHWGSRCRWWFHSVVDIELLAAPPLRRHHKELDSVTNKFMCMDYMKSIAVGSCKSKFIIQGLHKNKQNERRYLLKYLWWIFSIDLSDQNTFPCYLSFEFPFGFKNGKITCQENAVSNYPNVFKDINLKGWLTNTKDMTCSAS